MFQITEATESDIPAIRALAEKTWWPAYSSILSPEQIRYMLDRIYGPDILRKDISSGAQIFLLLRDEQGPQAFAAYSYGKDDPAVARLHKLYVSPDAQQRGYGRTLLRHIADILRLKNIHALDLNVNRYNTAKRFYEKNGFSVVREEDIPIGPYWMNDYVMRKEL